MDKLSEYLVKNPKQILLHIKTLASEKCLVAVNFGENHSFLSVIVDINEKKHIITIDCGPKEYLNKELLSLGIVNCKAEHKGIKVLFQGRGIKKAGKLGQPALSIQIPESIHWIQRRQFYRVRSPLSKNSYCTITFPQTELDKEENRTLNFQLFDLSATGFSILSESDELAHQLSPSTKFNNCQLVLDKADRHNVSFIVRSKFAVNPNKPNKNQRIGCEFISTSPKTESAFLRYMQEIEREIKRIEK
jgi:c-di-GMP-binding flagellar brake protein YcgR